MDISVAEDLESKVDSRGASLTPDVEVVVVVEVAVVVEAVVVEEVVEVVLLAMLSRVVAAVETKEELAGSTSLGTEEVDVMALSYFSSRR